MDISPVPVTDLPDVLALLADCDLPVADIGPQASPIFCAIREDSRLVAVVGFEVHGRAGLLRSLAVVPERRGAGLGRALVADAESRASASGVRALYLLTTTAAEFFRRLGYRAEDRASAPAAIRATAQFTGLCPASSTCMAKRLDRAGSA